jgi:hypothetical protein
VLTSFPLSATSEGRSKTVTTDPPGLIPHEEWRLVVRVKAAAVLRVAVILRHRDCVEWGLSEEEPAEAFETPVHFSPYECSTSSYVKAGLEPVHIIDDPGEPPFENGAKNLLPSAEFVKVGFYRDLSGIVHLQGELLVTGSSSAFTLPAGFRPQKSEIFNGVANEEHGGELRISPDGKVDAFAVFEPSLGSVMFRTD